MKKIYTLIVLSLAVIHASAQWVPQATGFSNQRGLSYIDAVNVDVAWAVAFDANDPDAIIQEFTRTIDAGETWTPGVVTGALGSSLVMINAINDQTAYALLSGGENQGVYQTTDGGVSWIKQSTPTLSSTTNLNILHFFDLNNGLIIGDPVDGDFEIFLTTNAGEEWTRIPNDVIPTPLVLEAGVSKYYSSVGDTVWFGTTVGRIYRSVNRGLEWEVFTVALGAAEIDVEFRDARNGIAQSKGINGTGRLSETSDGGSTWMPIESTGPLLRYDLAYVPATVSTYVATGASPDTSGMAFSFDGGHTWEYFSGTNGVNYFATDWIDYSTAWVGSVNQSNVEGGVFSFQGILEDSEPPTNVTAVVNGQDVTITWTAPVTTAEIQGYNLFRNDVMIATIAAEEQSYVDEDLLDGTYVYLLRTLHISGQSAPSNNAEVEITTGSPVVNIILDFEDIDDFSTDFGAWTTLDLDEGLPYTIQDVTFPGSGEPMPFIAFNPSTTNPPLEGVTAHNGSRFGASFSSEDRPNDDWIISPQVILGNSPSFSMWVQSIDPAFIESYNVLISTTDSNPESFSILEGPVEAPSEEWTFVTYSLDEYSGQQVYLAVQSVSDDSFILMVDELTISFTTGLKKSLLVKDLQVFPNPSVNIINIMAGELIRNVKIFNTSGQIVYESDGETNSMVINTQNIPKGLYLMSVTSKEGNSAIKVSIQ